MNLTFLTFIDTIIRKFKNQISILNLIFAMTEITHRLTSYMMNWIIKNELNHYFIFIILYFETVMQSQQQKWWWKSMNMKRIAAEIQHFHILTHLIISETIKQYTDYLMKFIKQLIKNTILFIKSIVSYFCFW